MPYASQVPNVEHAVIKPQKFVNTAIGVLNQELTTPLLFARESIDKFKGSEGDKLTFKYPGVLPWRTYAFRNDRTDPIIFDSITESVADLTVGDRIYSGVRITDEQVDFDEVTPQYLAPIQGKAIANGLNYKTSNFLSTTDFPVVIGNAEANLRMALLEARRVLNGLHAPQEGRTLVVGTDFEMALLLEKDLILAQNVGDSVADDALREATLGRLLGFRVVLDAGIEPDSAIAFAGNAFTLFTGAPYIPSSVPVGASANYNGFSLRWLRDYEMTRVMDRSLMDTYLGIAPVKDFLEKYNETNSLVERSADPHFVRAIGLTLGGTNVINDEAVLTFADLTVKTVA